MNHLLLVVVCCVPPEKEERPSRTETEWCQVISERFKSAFKIVHELEARTPNGSRCDVLTTHVAYEVDWCKDLKWAEAIGQALSYGLAFDRKPGIILLFTGHVGEDERYLLCREVCRTYDIVLLVFDTRTSKFLKPLPQTIHLPSAGFRLK